MSIRTLTIAAIKQLVVDECDLDAPTSDTHVTSDMLTRWTRMAVQKLMAVLNELRSDDWYVFSRTITTTPGLTTVEFPDVAIQIKTVVWLKSASERITLLRATNDDLTEPVVAVDPRSWDAPPRYTLREQSIELSPAPNAAYQLYVRYTLNYADADLINDADTFTIEAGWDDFILYEVSTRVYNRQEKMEMSAYAHARAQEAEAFIRENASGRDENSPMFVRRIHGRRVAEDGGWG